MPAFTLKTARAKLNSWLEAEDAVMSAQSYKIGSRELTRADLEFVRESIEYWAGMVEKLEAAESNGGLRRVTRVVPRDL